MTTQIKCRGFVPDREEWVFGSLIGNNVIVGDIVDFNDQYFNTEFWYKVDPESVGRYIGLNNSDNNEMYEGDVIDYKGMKGRVFFNEQSLQFMFETKDGGYEFANGQTYYDDDDERDQFPTYGTYKVIGNIYEDPELLDSDDHVPQKPVSILKDMVGKHFSMECSEDVKLNVEVLTISQVRYYFSDIENKFPDQSHLATLELEHDSIEGVSDYSFVDFTGNSRFFLFQFDPVSKD